MPTMMGWSKTNVVEGVTVLRNQPWRKAQRNAPIEYCTGTETYGGCGGSFGYNTCSPPPPPPPEQGPCLLGIILCG